MTTLFPPLRHLALSVVTTLVCLSGTLATAAPAATSAHARYRMDMAVCNSGQSNQSVANCRREAGSALAEARRGALDDVPDQYLNNALQRCQAHTRGDDRVACEARILGQGDISDASQAGGLLRQSTTVLPAQ